MMEIPTRLRCRRAVAKGEAEAALQIMRALKQTTHPEAPPALATDAKGGYREAMLRTWGKVPAPGGQGRPPTRKQPQEGWKYLQVKKTRSGSRLTGVRVEVVYGEREEVLAELGGHTAYIERSHLSSRQMNARVVRKTLSFSKVLRCLLASCAWEDALYNWTRPHKSLRQRSQRPGHLWEKRTPAMAAGLADHVWTAEALLRHVVLPKPINTV